MVSRDVNEPYNIYFFKQKDRSNALRAIVYKNCSMAHVYKRYFQGLLDVTVEQCS